MGTSLNTFIMVVEVIIVVVVRSSSICTGRTSNIKGSNKH